MESFSHKFDRHTTSNWILQASRTTKMIGIQAALDPLVLVDGLSNVKYDLVMFFSPLSFYVQRVYLVGVIACHI